MAQKYKVKNTTILHNKKTYAEGSIILLEEIEAKRLADFIELIPNQSSQEKKETVKSEVKSTAKVRKKVKTEVTNETTDVDDSGEDTDDK